MLKTTKKIERKPYTIGKFWTKEELKMVVKLWDTSTLQEMSDKLDRPKTSIQQVVVVMRKNGIKIARKRRNGYLALLINEVREELF